MEKILVTFPQASHSMILASKKEKQILNHLKQSFFSYSAQMCLVYYTYCFTYQSSIRKKSLTWNVIIVKFGVTSKKWSYNGGKGTTLNRITQETTSHRNNEDRNPPIRADHHDTNGGA